MRLGVGPDYYLKDSNVSIYPLVCCPRAPIALHMKNWGVSAIHPQLVHICCLWKWLILNLIAMWSAFVFWICMCVCVGWSGGGGGMP